MRVFNIMLKHKSFILGALTTSVTWIIVLYLYNKLTIERTALETITKLPVEAWRVQEKPRFELGQIKSIEEKLKRDAGYEQHSYNVIVSDRIGTNREIPDTRHKKCAAKTYNIPSSSSSSSISVIICFYNEHLNTLIRSVNSIIRRTPSEMLKEILLVDDFSSISTDGLLEELAALDAHKIQVLRNSKRQGLIRSRVFGARLATGDILVFLDSHIEVNTDWLTPLISPIVMNRTIVTVPVVDLISPDTFEYAASPIVKGGFNWGLHFKWDPLLTNVTDPTELILSPTMPGGLFAINRLYFKEVGEFDVGMDIWGGENLEISFRLWMCGGSMFIVPCSRIGHVFRKRRPYGSQSSDDTMLKNNLRLANVWLDNYKEYFVKTFKAPPTMNFGDITERLALRKSLECKPFEWYHRTIYPDMQIPGNKSLHKSVEPIVQPWYLRKRNYIRKFAIQDGSSKQCLTNLNRKGKDSVKKGDVLNLQKCSGKRNQQWFYTDKNEVILNQLLCLEARFAKEGASTTLNKCHESGADQEWVLIERATERYTIYNKATGMCLLGSNSNNLIDIGICGEPSQSGIWNLISS